jgi:hypothetical protein
LFRLPMGRVLLLDAYTDQAGGTTATAREERQPEQDCRRAD